MAHDRTDPETAEKGFESFADVMAGIGKDDAKPWKAPRSAGELHERVCRACEAIGADEEVLYRETAAQPLELARWLNVVETRQSALAAFGRSAMRNQDRPAFKCLVCQDTALVPGEPRARSAYPTMRYCGCHAGQRAQVGWWHAMVYGQPWLEKKHRGPYPVSIKRMRAWCIETGHDFDRMTREIEAREKGRPKDNPFFDGETI